MPSIKYKKKTYAGATFPVLEMTKAEYDALSEAKKMDGTVYMITDDTGGWEAENASYDNTTSGLTATNVQDALDEVGAAIQEDRRESYSTVSKAISTGTLDSNNCSKIGNVVNAAGRIHTMSVPASGTFFTIPEGYRPRATVKGTGYIYMSDSKMFPCPVTIFSSGNVDINVSSSLTATQVYFSATYAI